MRKFVLVCLIIFGIVFIFRPQLIIGDQNEPEQLESMGPLELAEEKVSETEDDFYKEIELFTDALTLIRSDYVEDTKYKDLIYGALKGMLSSLDPYSQFLDPDAYKEVKVETEGEFGGLGIEITVKDGILTIISPIDDTPAFKVGLKADDKIVKIEDELTKEITLMEAVKKLRGKPGTKVNITVMREGVAKLLDFTITRDIIKIKSIRKAKVFEGDIGYIRLSEFQERSPQELEEALRKLEKENMKSMILDLRNNPGGLLDSAVKVTEKFIPAGQVIVSTRGRMGRQNMVFKSGGRGKHRTCPMIVLISKGSASGSEIVAGAIQDYKRGILLGTKSFGKGSVQTVVPLGDGSALRLTTSKYFTPSGRCIHEEGIEPDVVVEFDETQADMYQEDESEKVFEEVVNQDNDEKEEDNDKNEVKTTLEEYMKEQGFYDNQLVRAVDLLKGIMFYQKQEEKQEQVTQGSLN
ncbi:MAG: S41 family peptidase [Candidatus Omnitrophica bacterium]|nr:S41 family peptidase [Candidatus Omnitrophota bacterium]